MRTGEEKKNVDILKRFLLMTEICTYYYINMLDSFQVKREKKKGRKRALMKFHGNLNTLG